MTIQVTVRNDHVDHNPEDKSKKIHLKVYEWRIEDDYGHRIETLVSEVWVDPGQSHSLYIWGNRYFTVTED